METEAFGLKIGDRIRLVAMNNDPDPMAPGETGTVTGFSTWKGWEQVQVDWDSTGRGLALIPGEDVWEIIETET